MLVLLILGQMSILANANPLTRRAAVVGSIVTDGAIVTTERYASLVRYAKFSSAAYASTCASPNKAVLVQDFSSTSTDTQGYVARDDSVGEIIVALRGSSSVEDIVTDAGTTLSQCTSPAVPYPTGATCHLGFQTAYNSVASSIISIVEAQLIKYPTYSITVTGHSLGASLASLASLSMMYNFKNNAVVLYNYGSPRTGNIQFADFHDTSFPFVNGQPTAFRSTHQTDGVPQVIRQGSNGSLAATIEGLVLIQNNPAATTGYKHHATELWQIDPPSQTNTVQCVGQEDSTCQDSQKIFAPLLGINEYHVTYYGVSMLSTSSYC